MIDYDSDQLGDKNHLKEMHRDMPVDRDFVFPKWTNGLPLIALLLAGCGAFGAHVLFGVVANPMFYEAGYAPDQPIPYSHRLHAGDLGIDCRYCHFNADNSSVAAVPSIDICMKCHAVVKKDSPKLQALHRAYDSGQALEWVRVHRVPDYVHFNHKAHVQTGMECQQCHGPVERMDKMKVVAPMSMGWCLKCHRSLSDKLPAKERTDNMAEILGYKGQTDHQTFLMMPWETVSDGDRILFHYGKRPLDQLDPPVHCSGCHQ